MSGWNWLENPRTAFTGGFILRVLLKAALLFVIVNALFAWLGGLGLINTISLYNTLVPGRERLPYGEDDRAYNLSLDSLEAMFASHRVSQTADDEFRVFLLGDSSVWGVLLRPDETLADYLNAADLTHDGRPVTVYNIGHPVMSLTKDVMLLDYAMRYDPDLIIWLTTLESFPSAERLNAPIVRSNPSAIASLDDRYDLNIDRSDAMFAEPSFMDQTIIGQRRPLADWLRLQLFGIMWAHTGIDQYYPDTLSLRTSDFDEDSSWKTFIQPGTLTESDLAFDLIAVGHNIAGDVPVVMINEPIFISDGRNSDLRYNLWYPRWAYDDYRDMYMRIAADEGWQLVDLWDSIAPDEFTDSPVHLTPAGSQQLADLIRPIINRTDIDN